MRLFSWKTLLGLVLLSALSTGSAFAKHERDSDSTPPGPAPVEETLHQKRLAKQARQARPPPAPVEHSVVMIMMDGSAWDVISTLYRDGELPHFKDITESKGGRFLRTISTYPSATAPSVPELLTGRYSDRTNQDFPRHVQEFNRNTGQVLRYAFLREAWDSSDIDLFDLVKQAGKQAYSYFEGEFAAADKNGFAPASYRFEEFTGYTKLPAYNYDRQVIDEVLDDLSVRPTLPDLSFIGLGIVDIMGHSYGPHSEQYKKMVIENDRDIGRLVEALRAKPHPSGGTLFDHTDFYIFGDHGMAPTDVRMTFGETLTRLGVTAFDASELSSNLSMSLSPHWYDNADLIVIAIGSNAADIHVRARVAHGLGRPWSERPSPALLRAFPLSKGPGTMDLVAFFQGHPGVDNVLVSDGPGRVRMMAAGGGEALVIQRQGSGEPSAGSRSSAYQVVRLDADGMDPLGYLSNPKTRDLVTMMGAAEPRFFDQDEWMTATADSGYPMAPILLPKAFTPSPTTPDIIVNLKNGFSCLALMNGDHANPTAATVNSFLVAAGPDLSKLPVDGTTTVRLIDVNADVRRTLGLATDPLADSRGLGIGPFATDAKDAR
jgi:hypothetical protein